MILSSNLASLWLQQASDNFFNSVLHSHAIALFCLGVYWYHNWHLPQKKGKENSTKIMTLTKNTTDDHETTTMRSCSSIKKRGSLFEESPSVISTSSEEESANYHQLSADEAVAEACPDATKMERERFLIAREWDAPSAIESLQNYLEWHNKHETIAHEHNIMELTSENDSNDDDNSKDEEIWIRACSIAMKANNEPGESNLLPQVIRTYKIDNNDNTNSSSVTDIDGYRIFHIMPAQMDQDLAQGGTYALATALFINLHLDRHKAEKITVCMDIRAGQGWTNIHAMYQIPFMKDTTTLLLSLFPERLHKCLVYPVPSAFLWIWNGISKIIDPKTVEKICLLAGPNKIMSPPPLEEMTPHLGKEVAEYLEQARVADFIVEESA